jgi:RIO kinase 1
MWWSPRQFPESHNAQIITNVLGKVKGGKEANVYCCAAHPSTGLDLIAAKLYRPQMFRNLRNDARYRQDRVVTDQDGKASIRRREALAVRKNTRFGQELRHVSWLEAEYQTLQLLYAAGVDVPRPLARGESVILMEYVGAQNAPAPSLNQIALKPAEARRIFDRLVRHLSTMLACHRVHADLSAYNILYWEGHFKLIDFPQAVDPRRNPDAADLFMRDVERLCQYFARYGVVSEAPALATELWGLYQRSNALDASVVAPLLGGPLENGET